MQELLVDFITSLDGYGAAEGWPGWWGLEGPEYLAWLGRQPERDYTILMGANTYRLMSGFVTESTSSASEEPMTDEGAAIAELATASKVVLEVRSRSCSSSATWASFFGRPGPLARAPVAPSLTRSRIARSCQG